MALKNKINLNDSLRGVEFDQFIGKYPNAIPLELCSNFAKWFDSISKQGMTMSALQELTMTAMHRNDESVALPQQLPEHCFPRDMVEPFWHCLQHCMNVYFTEYDIERALTSYSFKAHRVQPKGGYHDWHHEHDFHQPYRVLAWMAIIEAPVEGAETEFLWQTLRIPPEGGQVTIWPAGFTHKHRGLPPLRGHKTYLTGWFDMANMDYNTFKNAKQ